MNIKKTLLCTAVIASQLIAGSAVAASSVWKVSKGNDYFYLGGTIHVLSANDHPLPDEYFQAYQDASEVIFETDMAASQSPEFQAKFMAAISFSDARTLESELTPATYKKLDNYLASRQMPIANFSKIQPWGVSLMITMVEYQRLGMMPGYGVDAWFNNLAMGDNKKTSGLETPEKQLMHLASMADIDPNEGVEYTLRDLKRLPELIQLMKSSWRSGDLAALNKHSLITEMKTEFPEMYESLITTRNNAWMETLVTLTNDTDREFVLVGAMHLDGKDGVLAQLQSKGFRVEQL